MRARLSRRQLGVALGAALTLFFSGFPAVSAPHKRNARGKQPEFPKDAAESPACRIGALTPTECLGELERLGIHFRKGAPSPGVVNPVRLLGPVGGVVYRTDYPDSRRATVPYEVFDCRLVIALAEFGPRLTAHGIDEVRIFSAWRPPPKGWPEGKPGTAHLGGLAADLRLFKKSDGTALDVEKDFHGRIGSVPCGPGKASPSPDTPQARELRDIYCGAAEARLFNVLLSPDHDVPHRNHFHVEIRPYVRWFIVR